MMKKKSGKRFLSWLLAVVMIIALMPAIAFAEPPTESSGNTEPAVTSYCPSSEGGTDVSVGGYDSSPAAETKDIPTEEPVKDTPTDEPAKDTPTEEPVKESPVADKTTEGALAQEGAVENSTDEKITKDLTNEVSAAELAGLTGMLGAPVSLELYANKSYPIYVYGYFVNGKDKNDEDNILSGKDGLFGKDIKIQKDNKKVQTVKWNDYSIIGKPKSDYITFGKIENGTTVKPAKNAEKESISADVLEAMPTASLGDSTDMQNQYFSWKDVAIDDWDLHIARDATNYSDADKYTWHMDGKIHTYKIKYMADGSDVSQNANVDKNIYYCGEYTIDTYEPQAPKGKVFAGWKVKDDTSGKYYQGGDTITLNEFGDKATITLEAQWENLPVYVYGCFKHKNANGTDENLGSTAALYVNGNQVNWNPDNAKGEYYITFGKLANATNADPSDYSSDKDSAKISTNDIKERINNGEVVLSNDTGSAKANNLIATSAEISSLVSSWSGLKSRAGAASYAEETADKQTWHLDGTIYLYKVTYDKGEIDEEPNLPKETTYFLGNYTVNNQEPTSNKFNFTGWKLKGEDDSLSTVTYKKGDPIPNSKKDITLVAQWERKPVAVTFKIEGGTWADDTATDQVKFFTLNENGSYNINETTDVPHNMKPDADHTENGAWYNATGNKVSFSDVTITEDTTYTYRFEETKYNEKAIVTFKVVNGTWANGTIDDKVVPIALTKGKGTLNATDVPSGMLAKAGYDNGKWNKDPNTAENAVTEDVTYTFSFAPKTEIQPDKITDTLNKLVWKKFESQHGYSTEGTFTAIAKVMPVHPEINSYAAEVDESSDNNTNTPGTDNAKTFTGTVNLKTGETRAFNFSAGKGVADVLDPDTYYEVRVSEVEGNLSKVTYDTTKYILKFATDENSEVLSDIIRIWTGEDIAEGDGKKPVKVDKITFQNIYTYKRHHSSSDSGNGGGKKEEKPTVEIKDDDALGLNNTDHFAYIVGYGNGEVRPQNSITRAEVAAIFFRLLEDDVRDANYTRQNKFTDVSNDAWYCSAVSTLSAMGIISGYPDATFRPNASITRAEFAAIATRFDVNGDKTPASFNDIAGHWAKDEIAVAANNGWVNGYEDGSFRPQNKITRAETMSLVNRVLNRKPETAEDLLENMTKWTDNADTNAWYYLAVQEATNSHYYEYKENSQYEKWTELRETRDWSELDK